MNRLKSLIRLARTLRTIWSWRAPRGVQVYTRVDVELRWVAVLLTDGDSYGLDDGPWAEMGRAEILRRLAAAARVLADEREPREARPAPWSCPSLAQAGAEFEMVVERQKREMRRRREIIPITEGNHRKGGA